MYIENLKNKKEDTIYSKQEQNHDLGQASASKIGRVFLHWQAPEYENYARDRKWYVIMTLALMAIIAYAVFTNSPIMAIVFILIGIIEYVYISREPELLDFAITEKGVIAGKEIYEFEELHSFWIFYEEGVNKSLSLHTKNNLFPFIQIPLHEADPREIQAIMLQHIPEKKQEPRLADTLNRLLRL